MSQYAYAAATRKSAATVVAGGKAPEVLEAAEHALDGVAVAVKHPRETEFPAPVGLGWDVRHGAILLHLMAHSIAVVTLVTMNDARWRHLLQQCRSSGTIRDLATGQKKGDRPAVAIGQGMDLGRAPTARAANRLVLLPPFAARCRAVGLYGGTVDRHLCRRPAGIRKGIKERAPHALGRPPDVAVVECLARPVIGRRIDPAPAQLQQFH